MKFTTPRGETVLNPFGGTGTTLRVCRRLGYPCTLIEIDDGYSAEIVKEHGMKRSNYNHRTYGRDSNELGESNIRAERLTGFSDERTA